MSLRISIASIAIATLLGGCGRGQAFDPFMEELKDASTNSCTQTPTSMCGTQPMVTSTPVIFPNPPSINGCQMLKTTISSGAITLEAKDVPFPSQPNTSFQFSCWVTSNAFDIPDKATRIVLRFKATHSFATNLSNPRKPRITYGKLAVRTKTPTNQAEWLYGFQPQPIQGNEVRMELPLSLAGKSVVVEPWLSGFAYDWDINDRFTDLQLALTDLAFETTQ